MAQWVKVLDTKSDSLSPFPDKRMVERENQLLKITLSPPHMCCGTHALPPHKMDQLVNVINRTIITPTSSASSS